MLAKALKASIYPHMASADKEKSMMHYKKFYQGFTSRKLPTNMEALTIPSIIAH